MECNGIQATNSRRIRTAHRRRGGRPMSDRPGDGRPKPRVPRSFKVAYLAFLAVLVPVYAHQYGWFNFLWFSNLALIAGCVAACLENRRLASMCLVAVGLLECGWIAAFLGGLLPGGGFLRLMVGYMFDPEIPLLVRGLSLYHAALPFVLFWLVRRLGYDRTTWKLCTLTGWLVLAVSYWQATPARSINWVLGPLGEPQSWTHPLA